MDKKIFIILALIICITGCAMVKHIKKGEFYNFCQDMVTNSTTIESSTITINSQGYFAILFDMSENSTSIDKQYISIFNSTRDYLHEINNGDRTFADEQFKEDKIREIAILILYSDDQNDESFSYHSHYYGGETIYSDDDLNIIDNFETWYGP